MMAEIDLDIERRMDGSDSLSREFSGLRTGRASANLLDPVMVEAYGSQMPMNQVGMSAHQEGVYLRFGLGPGLMKAVEKAIMDSELGLNPRRRQSHSDSDPDLSEERRMELKKVAGRYAEQAKVAVRNVRGMAWIRSNRWNATAKFCR